MAYIIRVTAYPDIPPRRTDNGDIVGGFLPSSFDDLIHRQVQLPGLAPTWTHTLVDVTVADDRASAELVLHSEAPLGVSLDRNLRVTVWQPPARVKAFDLAGALLAEAALDAPLRRGQLVEVAGRPYTVAAEPTWPHREGPGGRCRGAVDWQHVTLTPSESPATLPVEATG